MTKKRLCKTCGRKVNPKYHVCPPVETIGITVPGFFPMVFTEEQYEELRRINEAHQPAQEAGAQGVREA